MPTVVCIGHIQYYTLCGSQRMDWVKLDSKHYSSIIFPCHWSCFSCFRSILLLWAFRVRSWNCWYVWRILSGILFSLPQDHPEGTRIRGQASALPTIPQFKSLVGIVVYTYNVDENWCRVKYPYGSVDW